MKPIHLGTLLLMTFVLAACASKGHRAPVVDRSVDGKRSAADAKYKKDRREKDWRPESITVKKGDTLYSIAFNYGFDYHELAELNGIKDPSLISIGQEIRLFPGRTMSSVRAGEAAGSKPAGPVVKDQPRLVKYPYSEAAMAQIDKVQEPAQPAATPIAKTEDTSKSNDRTDDTADDSEDAPIEWGMPTQGKLIGQYSESANRKGIDIAGKLGQPVLASAAGKVVYSGSGLRGYGKLIIIKHNKTYLSAYAHNDKVLVKEGQSVTRGQKIAEMGNTDADRVELHFEVRRLGKPVDPAKYLPIGKS
ncbi:MAG: peptidoglycan DD-metalloendopeptidase family protein [Gallionella sp.]